MARQEGEDCNLYCSSEEMCMDVYLVHQLGVMLFKQGRHGREGEIKIKAEELIVKDILGLCLAENLSHPELIVRITSVLLV